MTTTTPLTSRMRLRTGISAACLAAGALFGLLSVYSGSRASCALWVTVALILTFVSGLLFQPGRRKLSPGS